jgi:1D-myo-inositol 3-kinase
MFSDSDDKEEAKSTGKLGPERLPVLVVGHYCHDRITLPDGSRVDALGGSVSYILNVFKALGMKVEVVSKVGPDFIYSDQLSSHLPEVVENQFTTEFFADFISGDDRTLKVGNICDPIFAHDVPDRTFELGLAVGIAGEVLPETIQVVAQNSRIVIADVQALIRNIDPISGLVSLRRLEDTPYYSLLSSISFLKAARIEASFIDIEQVRKMTCVIVTEGKNGSRVYSKEMEFRVPAFHATEVDPTGAGDCFLAGFSAGLYQGLTVYQAVRMGNYFGALAVEQIGVPSFNDKHLEVREKRLCAFILGQTLCISFHWSSLSFIDLPASMLASKWKQRA